MATDLPQFHCVNAGAGDNGQFNRRYCVLGVPLSIESNTSLFLECFDDVYFHYIVASHWGQFHNIVFNVAEDNYEVSIGGRADVFFRRKSWPSPSVFVELLLEREVRDFTFLHASSVEVDGKAYLFSGPSTSGKTTLALALAKQGARMMSEDRTPVNFARGTAAPFPTRVNVRYATRVMASENGWSEAFGFDPPVRFAQEIKIGGVFFVSPADHGLSDEYECLESLQEYTKMRTLLGMNTSIVNKNCATRLRVNGPASFQIPPNIRPCDATTALKRLGKYSSCGPEPIRARIQSITEFLSSVHVCLLTPGHIYDTTHLILATIGSLSKGEVLKSRSSVLHGPKMVDKLKTLG